MTQDDLLLLERGRVPIRVVTEALQTYRRTSERDVSLDIDVLSEKARVPRETLMTYYLDPDRFSGISFDVADNLLCACGLYEWWRSRFAEYYYGVNLRWVKCGCPGCEVMFEIAETHECRYEGCSEQGRTRGLCGMHYQIVRREGLLDEYPPQGKNGSPKYCSPACSDSAWNQAHGRTHKPVKHLRGRASAKKCRNGHDRTPENIKTRKDGRTECVLCARETAKRNYRAKRAQLAA
jgi:hypothetical protein